MFLIVKHEAKVLIFDSQGLRIDLQRQTHWMCLCINSTCCTHYSSICRSLKLLWRFIETVLVGRPHRIIIAWSCCFLDQWEQKVVRLWLQILVARHGRCFVDLFGGLWRVFSLLLPRAWLRDTDRWVVQAVLFRIIVQSILAHVSLWVLMFFQLQSTHSDLFSHVHIADWVWVFVV